MPTGPIVDAHVHLWDPQHFRMPWLDGDALLNRQYLLAEYGQHTERCDITALVYLEVDVAPHYGLLEARWAADLARRDRRLQAIVAHAPLEYGEQVAAYLQALVAIDPLVKGVRRIVQSEPDTAFCLEPRFVAGTQLLPRYGLSCDLCINHTQLAATVELVRRCPETSFMLDHLGKPAIKEGLLDPWRAELRALAALPNVLCKVSGAVTEADHAHWTADDLAPFIHHALENFGEDRVVFGGDWPVALHASAYPRWVDTLDTLTTGLSEGARRKLWSENARSFYRLSPLG